MIVSCPSSQRTLDLFTSLNTTYPSPLPDHRVLLAVVFVPCAHGLASTPMVAYRWSTFASERLIGIFWVRRMNLLRLPCVQSIVQLYLSLLNWRLRSLVARACRAKKNQTTCFRRSFCTRGCWMELGLFFWAARTGSENTKFWSVVRWS